MSHQNWLCNTLPMEGWVTEKLNNVVIQKVDFSNFWISVITLPVCPLPIISSKILYWAVFHCHWCFCCWFRSQSQKQAVLAIVVFENPCRLPIKCTQWSRRAVSSWSVLVCWCCTLFISQCFALTLRDPSRVNVSFTTRCHKKSATK